MRHAILGAGGVGGLMAASLKQVGEEVVLLVQPHRLAQHPSRLHLESRFGVIDVPVAVAGALEERVDVVWLAVKATQLEDAIQTLGAGAGWFGALLPLLNGVDHVSRLRSRFGNDRVIPATIRVESERIAPGRIVHRSPFARLTVAESGRPLLRETLDKLAGFGFACEFSGEESTLLWSKLIFLAPLALATSAAEMAIGGLMGDAEWRQRVRAALLESAAVAAAEGAKIDVPATWAFMEGLPGQMRSSMQKDIEAGRAPELDAIAGPILRGGLKHGIATPVTQELVERISRKMSEAMAASQPASR